MSPRLTIAIAALIALTGCSRGTVPATSQTQASQPAGPVVKIVSVSRVNEWAPGEMEGLTLTKGVSVTAVNGNFTKFQADPGYEIAVVKVSMVGGSASGVPLEEVAVTDDKAKTYPGIAAKSALKKEITELGFAVPEKTALTKLQLNKTMSFDLTSVK